MQNICSINKDKYHLKEDNENSLESEPNSSRCVQGSLPSEEKYYSDSELKIISKKRSPFVRAFRSFSRSSSSKGKLKYTTKKEKSIEESNKLNGNENFEESLESIEKKQRKKIFLAALTKTKIVPSEIKASDDVDQIAETKLQNNQLEDLYKEKELKSENNASETNNENKQRLQIIISGKKVDPHIRTDREKIESLITNNTEAKTEICFHSIATGSTDLINQKPGSISKEKKFKPKKITSVVALTHRKKETGLSTPKTSFCPSVLQEKITITQHLCDTPPIEKAPTKSNIAASEVGRKVPNTGASLKSIARSTIQTNSVSNRRYSSLRQRIETDIKKLPQVGQLKSGEVVGSKPQGQDLIKNLPSNKLKSNLMQESSSSISRGHRFPKPSKVLAVIGKDTKLEHTKSKNTGIEKTISESKIQPSESNLIEYTYLRSELKNNSESSNVHEKFIKAESIEIIGDTNRLEFGDSADSNAEIQNLSKESRRRIRYVAPSIFDVYDSLTASSAIEQTENVHLGVIAEDKIDNKGDEISNESMSSKENLSKDVQIEAVIMASNNPTNTEKREHLYKILVIGELGCGKTSFIKRYVHQFFSQNYRATIGVDFALKVLQWDPNTIVRLQLWDIAGQERFGNMTRVYYKEAVGAFIVFDVTRSGTFECVSKWKDDLDSKVQLPDGSPIPCILLANKCDQEKQGPVTSNDKMDDYVRENGFTGWFETSAKENINIDEAAKALVNKILLNDKLISTSDLRDSEKFNLNTSTELNDKEINSKCAC